MPPIIDMLLYLIILLAILSLVTTLIGVAPTFPTKTTLRHKKDINMDFAYFKQVISKNKYHKGYIRVVLILCFW